MEPLITTILGRHRRRPAWSEVAGLRAEVARLRRELAAERHAARHDALTGLRNRRGFCACAEQLLAAARSGQVAAMVADLDDFKPINDTHGHGVGDQVLAVTAFRLAAHARSWLLGRLGGDEFAGLRVGDAESGRLLDSAAQLANVLATPMIVDGVEVRVRAAIGLAVQPAPVTFGGLLCRADEAMYHAKSTGRPVLWHPGLENGQRHRPDARPIIRTRDLRVPAGLGAS